MSAAEGEFCDEACRDRAFDAWLDAAYTPAEQADMPPRMISQMRLAYHAATRHVHPSQLITSHGPDGLGWVILPVAATEEHGVDDVPWRISLAVPDGYRLVQVFPQAGPSADGMVACVLERVG